ncbi:hypothetical protein BB561_005208 [Smittium simulii]|uniref:Uncharacterized protein n=1 Tax=Smittium simulii TaxID=133385 RepID=A0A2T9YBF9_9FUNG|nr:hypothetical protein BB561_005208 [Smittium simulii]
MSNCKSDVKVLNQFLEKGLICSLGQNRCFANIIQVNGTQIITQTPFSTYKLQTPKGDQLNSLYHHSRLIPAYNLNNDFSKLWTRNGLRNKRTQ